MRELLPILFDALAAGRASALCRLVETRGSTPRKAGAAMVVHSDGSQAGTLGGGCVEAEVKRKAIAAIESRERRLERFQLDDDYGWDDGLICGGRMQVLIDPVSARASREYLERLSALITAGQGVSEAIVIDADLGGGDLGASCLFDAREQVIATLGNVAPDSLRKRIVPLHTRPRPYAEQGVAVLPYLPRCPLVIVGGGHVGQAVAKLASELDFLVTVVDDRPEYLTMDRFPTVQHRIAGKIGDILPGLEVTSDTYCLIVTRGHNNDEEALFHLADRGACYVGMIGSKRKIRLIFDDLIAEGVSPESLAKVHAPVGLDIGSQTVPEIAVSIAAELIAHRNRGHVADWERAKRNPESK